MTLSIGIVGLPNVGKSTAFNALTQEQNAQAENYPFCTIQPNKAIVPVPDSRLDRLAELVGVKRRIYATVEFVDVAGLVQGASQGEGLGNQFLGNIRDVNVILHVVRCFDDENVVHVNAQPNPTDDISVIDTELALADLQQLERRIEKLERQVKGERELQPLLDLALNLLDYIGEGHPIGLHPERDTETFAQLNAEMRFLTAKSVIYVANVDEDGINLDNDYAKQVREIASERGAKFIRFCARLEQDLIGLTDEERFEYMTLAGIKESGLETMIRTSYETLGLISYFSFNYEEARAWTIQNGWTAPQAAGVIHTDFEKGFIRAEVLPFHTFEQQKSWAAARDAGVLRVEGRDYVVHDGDVIHFRFNV